MKPSEVFTGATLLRCCRIGLGALLLIAPARLLAAEKLPAEVRTFFSKYCLDCHDNATAKAKLSLESLPVDFQNVAWIRVHDRLKAGDMPPAEMPRPKPAEVAGVTRWLAGELTNACQTRQDREGRVPLRRMNRREYETTLHDLLGIATPLRPILPEDNSLLGFDTVSRGLETSSAHLLRFQQAADVAIEAALPGSPIISAVTRWNGRKYLEQRLPVHRTGIDPFVRIDGDAFVLHARISGDNSMQAPHPPVPGRYRIRAAVRPVNTNGKPLSVLIGKRMDRFQVEKLMHIIDVKNVSPHGTTLLEIETDLKYSQGNQFIYFEGLELPSAVEFAKQRGDQDKKPLPNDFGGPGLAIDWAELEGPLDVELGRQRLFGDLPKLPRMPPDKKLPENWRSWPMIGGEFGKYPLVAISESPAADADRLIRAFLPLALRRPATEVQATHYVQIVHDQLNAGATFDEAMRAGYKAILCSPWFLNYVESPGRLDDFALAARLARFLWNSLPDQQLATVAAQHALTRPEVLRAETERMLKDPKAARFARSFVDQWLDLGKFLDMKPDELYVEYDDTLAWSIPQETRQFFDEVLVRDLPTSSFVHTDWTFLNSRLATHYGIPDVEGLGLVRVALPAESHRGGVITQASILKLTTNASYTSPVKRGAWILERIIGKPPAPPPPNVKAVEPDIRGATTIREQLDKHKNVAACAACHVQIDPPGFALENFDVIGGWRDRYRVKPGGQGNQYVELPRYPGRKVWLAKPVQADGETAAGERFRDVDDYKQLVLRDPDQLTRNLAEKLIVYATGAEIEFADRAVVEQIVRQVKARNHGFRTLIHAVVQSPVFLHK